MDDSTTIRDVGRQTLRREALDKAIHTAKAVYAVQKPLLRLDAGEEA